MEITLAPQQLEAEAKIMAWLEDEDQQTFTLAGYAGTGKTTLNRKLEGNIGGITYAAYTGKAVNILREKGCRNVETIHSLLYKPVGHDKSKLHELQKQLVDAQQAGFTFDVRDITRNIENMQAEFRKPKFELNEAGGGELVIVDEYSMLPADIITDLKRKYRKILFTGDPFQLPPVNGKCTLEPDFFLTEIHRQALESAIVRMSKDIRENQTFGYGDYGDLLYIPQSHAAAQMYLEADQVIVGQNNTRNAINQWMRAQKGIASHLPIAGEKLICLKNNKKLNLFNGMICQATADAHKKEDRYNNYLLRIDAMEPDADDLSVWEGDVMGFGHKYDWNDWNMKSLQRFDYAYAITCHKSQGSEFATALVYNEPIGENDLMKRRWLYTAITRAKSKCILVQP